MKNSIKKLTLLVAGLILLSLIAYLFISLRGNSAQTGFASGNGRIEATEIDIAPKMAGKIESILVNEGDFVEEGQILAVMQSTNLAAQLEEARALHFQAMTAEESAQARITQRESEVLSAESLLAQRESELDAAQRRYKRSATLAPRDAISIQTYDDDETKVSGAEAAVASARAQVSTANATLSAARAEARGAQASARAAEATIKRIQSDLDDCQLTAPRSGRVQFRIAQPGEVMAAGGKVLNLVDLSDVYMTFFLPEAMAGKVGLGGEVRVVLDAIPGYAIPARISFVSSIAQFTPKTVETQSERQKLMFRVKARISPELLRSNLNQVKTGLPGVAWVRLDAAADWPPSLGKLVEP